jgi:uncharacterized membrane protein
MHREHDLFERATRAAERVQPSDSGDTGSAALLGGLGVGALLMYFFDPSRGTRRRKLVADKAVRARHVAGEALAKSGRDFRNRVTGAAAVARNRFAREEADDRVLEQRVRAILGRVVSHPGAITVTAEEGYVTLVGDILENDADRLLQRVLHVRGVKEVSDQLTVHRSAEGIPSLQGGVPRTGDEFELRQENWTPAARVATTVAGGALAIHGMRRGGLVGAAIGLTGLALTARGATNKQLKRVVGVGGGRKAIDVQKTINIDAPLATVFRYCTDYSNWPHFMTNVKEVRESGAEQQHWVVEGPAGFTLEWDSEITRFITNKLVSWKSVEGSAIRHAGTMRFDENAAGTTRVHIEMSYNPPAGAAGHVLAKLFGVDPKSQMDEDLARLKTTIETGTPPHDAAVPTRANPSFSAATDRGERAAPGEASW